MRRAIAVVSGVVLGACGWASLGSAETLEPSVLVVARPAFYQASVLDVRRGPRRGDYPRPRGEYDARPPRQRGIQGWISIRGGGYRPEDLPSDQWTLGMKVTGKVGDALRLGLSTDLHRRSDNQSTIVSEYVDPAGNRVTRRITTGETESNLVPILGVAEIEFPSAGIHPYVGAGLGWQFLNVRAVDFNSGIAYDTDYDGPAGQIYAGVEVPVAPRARVSVETYGHGGRVEQEVFDIATGVRVEERIRTNGWGVRGGLNFAF